MIELIKCFDYVSQINTFHDLYNMKANHHWPLKEVPYLSVSPTL